MKMLSRIACLGLAMVLPAISSAQAPNPKTADCERKARAAELKGPERQAFIKRCMAGAPVPAPDKLSDCQRKAREAEVDRARRKAFVTQCMTGAPATPQAKMDECQKKAQAAELKGKQKQVFINQCIKS
jgi:hypothetical protein